MPNQNYFGFRKASSLRKLQLHSCTNTTQNHVKRYPSINLPSLDHLGGPPGYVSAVARHLRNCAVVWSLGVTFTDAHSASPLIPQLLDITHHFSNLLHLQVSFQLSTGCITEEIFSFPVFERCVIRVTDVEITNDRGFRNVDVDPVVS